MSRRRTTVDAAREPSPAPRSVGPAERVALAFAASVLTAFSGTGGLFFYASTVQTGVMSGLVSGAIAPSAAWSAIVGGIAAAAAVAFGPASLWHAEPTVAARAVTALAAGGVGAAVGWGARLLVQRRGRWPAVVVAIALALAVGNLWATTLTVDSRPFPYHGTSLDRPSLWQQLSGESGNFPASAAGTDNAWYYRIVMRVKAGRPYYQTFAEVLQNNQNWAKGSVTSFRLPTLFWLWALLPDGRAVVVSFLVLASLGALSVVPIVRGAARLPLAVPASVALCAVFLNSSTGVAVFFHEVWAAIFALFSAAALSASLRSKRWRLLTVVSVAFALLAVLARETLVFALLAGVVAAAIEPTERRFRLTAWLTGVALFAVAYGAHAYAVRPYLAAASMPFARGGVAYAVAALQYGTILLGGAGVLVAALALLGLVGAFMMPERTMRVFAVLLTLMPLAAFLVMRNRAWSEQGSVVNYWGAGVVPTVYAFIPAGLMVLASPRVGRAAGWLGARVRAVFSEEG